MSAQQSLFNKKYIFIGVGIVLAAAALTLAGLYLAHTFGNGGSNEPAPDPVNQVLKPDTSKDYKACDMLEKSFIQATLGPVADDLQGPDNNGIVGNINASPGTEGLESDSHVCVYAFSPGGTFENGFNSSDALNILVTKYTNEGGPAAFIESIRSEALVEEIDDLGDSAFYNANTATVGPGATYSFTLQVFTDNTLIEYTISQPAETTDFTAETAKEALVTLAREASNT